MSKPNSYKDIFFPPPKDSKKTLDKDPEVVYTESTAPDVPFNPDYKAFSIVRLGHKKYLLVTVELDSSTMTAGQVTETVEYETESRCVTEMNKKLATRSREFRKEDK